MKNPGLAAPVDGVMTIIHRDHTFEYDGRIYSVIQGGTQWGYTIYDDRSLPIADGFDTLWQIRDFVDACRRNGWDLNQID